VKSYEIHIGCFDHAPSIHEPRNLGESLKPWFMRLPQRDTSQHLDTFGAQKTLASEAGWWYTYPSEKYESQWEG
jgi:hypothetical protein